MITYQEALDIITQNPFQPKTETVSLNDSDGRVLAEDITADRDLPPYDRVTMDGISINFKAYKDGQRAFEIEKTIGAGMPKSSLEDAAKCVQIMTGAIMPDGADTVIRYEDITIENNIATINEEVLHQQNIHFKGEDKKQSEIVLAKGVTLGATEAIVAAAVGKSSLEVIKLPKAAIITTGDELVDIDETPLAHQVRRSSNYGAQNVLKQWGIDSKQYHLKDDKALMVEEISRILEAYELVVITGGVSRGKFDYLPEVLDELGVTKHFHKVKQRPGKPFWFGTAQNGSTVFALPGNPVSSFVCANAYIRPWLKASQGMPYQLPPVKLMNDITFKPDLTYFLECSIRVSSEGVIEAQTFKGNGSGDFANMIQADGFVVLPQGKTDFKAGEVYPYIAYRSTF
ncbi:MAG: molybdopterin molybdotransferase MoeA [Roseivirga sp.]|nr:molybdopterin molybdotransferase MoeA [Roseivirga sp.]